MGLFFDDDENLSVNTEDVAEPLYIDNDSEDETDESGENLEVADPNEIETSDDENISSTKETKKEKTEDDSKYAAARRESERIANLAQQNAFALKQRQDEFARQYGFNTFEDMEEFQRAQTYINQGYDENVAKKLADVDKLEKDLKTRAQQVKVIEQKKALADDPYFKELEPEIDAVLQANPHLELDVKVLFHTIKGQNFDKLVSMKSKEVKQQALNSINSKNHIKPDAVGYENDTFVLDEAEWNFYKRLNPKGRKEDYIKFAKNEKKGR